MPDSLSHGQTSRAFFGRQFSRTSQTSGLSDAFSTSSDRKVISQKSKKKPDPIDVALENEGMCRKLIPRDGNTIFRAVSDQLFGTQAHQQEVREALMNYFYEKHEELQQIIENYQNGNNFIDLITHKMVSAVQNCFRVHIELFEESGKKLLYKLNAKPDEKTVRTVILAVDRQLCWDSVYPITYLQAQGLCQSLIYEVLYEEVFKLKNVPFAVENMLGKPKKRLQQAGRSKPNKEAMLTLLTNSHKDASLTLDLKVLIEMGIPPFPYKVAKSLSPFVYRNAEYDVCEAIKGPNNENIRKNFLFEGCKCIIHKRSNYRYYGYVQRLFPELGKAIVFVEQLGELCEIAIDLIEPVIVAKKSNARSKRKAKYIRRNSFVDRDEDDFPEEDELDDYCFIRSDDVEDFDIASIPAVDSEPEIEAAMEVESEEQPVSYCGEANETCIAPIAPNVYNHQMGFNVIPAQTTFIVDTAFNCIVATYGPYNGAKVPGYTGLINKSAIPSYLPDGSDLPFSDNATLRFFFNLGQKHFHAALYTLLADQNLVCMVSSVENLPACSKYQAHLLSPTTACSKRGRYPLCQYVHEMTCGCTNDLDNVHSEWKKDEESSSSDQSAFGSSAWMANTEKTFEDILNGNPACLNLISWEKSGVCRTCMFHYFGSYFAHYPRAFPFPVNLCCQPSMAEDGNDLPFNDTCSLRYFYNLGIRNHQAAELTFLHQQEKIDYEQMFGDWPDVLETECAIHHKFGGRCEVSDKDCKIYDVYRNALEKQFSQNISLVSQVTIRPVQMHTLHSEVPLSSYVVPGSSHLGLYGGI